MNSKTKRFSSGSALTTQISQSLAPVGDDDAGFESIAIERVQVDPENPRELHFNPADPRLIADDDPKRAEKEAELEEIMRLALTIKSQGMSTPIRVYRVGRFFRIIVGERRYWAHIINGAARIDAIIMKERPKALRLMQFVENASRRGLSLYLRAKNLRAALEENDALAGPNKGADFLMQDAGISRTQAFQYLAVLGAPKDVWEAMERGLLTNLDQTALIARIADPVGRARAIRDGDIEKPGTPAKVARGASAKPGRPATAIKLGTTSRTDVIRRVVETIAGAGHYTVDWTDVKAVSKVFKQLLADMETDKL